MTIDARPPERRPCKGCRMQLVFARGEDGGRLPLQRVRKLFLVRLADGLATPVELERLDDGHLYAVSHFETCPRADDFSRARARRKAAARRDDRGPRR